MNDARSIVRWLSKQRNSEGGFISTQDTVVGLQVKLTEFTSFHELKFVIVLKYCEFRHLLHTLKQLAFSQSI